MLRSKTMIKAGDELSISLKDVPELANAKKGDEIEICIACKVIGQHTHSLGKTEKMIDLEVMEFEAEAEDEDEEEESD